MSDLYVIDDSTPQRDLVHPANGGRGLELPPASERSYAGVAEPFPLELLIPRHEWQARIQERQARKARVWDMCDRYGVVVKDQQQTNLCWANAPVHCVEILGALQGQGYTPLSAASVAGPIKGYRNVGGWGREALEYIVANGVVPASAWPSNAISRSYYTDANRKAAAGYKADEWWVLDNRDLDQLVSCLLRGFPVAVGYNWWGHEVTATEALWVDGAVAIGIDNSWGQAWGTNGRGVLQGNRMLPDDAVCARTISAR